MFNMSRHTGKFLTNYNTFFLFLETPETPVSKKGLFSFSVYRVRGFLAIDKPSCHQELSTTINLSSCDHVIQSWRNWFNFNWWNTGYCSDPTTARHRAIWTYYTFGSVRATSKMVVIDCHFSVVMRGADGVMLR